jgi:predicted metal-dependent phosphoesterase TrpH
MKFDLHVHSAYSPDCATPVEKLADRYSQLGFAGFALTDHDSMGGIAPLRAYAKEKKLLLEIIGGCEFLSEKGEVIGLFIEEFVKTKNFGELCDSIHDQGGLVVLPHPFDSVRRKIVRPDLLSKDELRLVDGIEAFNSRCVFASDNKKAQEFAKASGLFQTAGSDCHFLFESGNAALEIDDGKNIAIALKKKEAKASGKLSPFFVHGPTTLVKYAKKFGILQKG